MISFKAMLVLMVDRKDIPKICPKDMALAELVITSDGQVLKYRYGPIKGINNEQ